MEYIKVTSENLETEYICCAISGNNDIQVSSKKAWLRERFADGLVFLKSVERGKCFIEYLPAENAWNPIDAVGYLYIDCLWVSGSFKGHGYSTDLLNACIEDAKEKSVPFKAIHLESKKDAQNAPTPITTYALFYNGKYLTNEQMNDKRFLKLLEREMAQ